MSSENPDPQSHTISLQNTTVRNAVYVFGDIRGFSAWSERYQLQTADLLEVVYSLSFGTFGDRREQAFLQRVVKLTGDGFFAVHEYPANDAIQLRTALASVVRKCDSYLFAIRSALKESGLPEVEQLAFGFGITFGPGFRFYIQGSSHDYVGERINLAARLCDVAEGGEILGDQRCLAHLQEMREIDPRVSGRAGVRDLKKMGTVTVTEIMVAPF